MGGALDAGVGVMMNIVLDSYCPYWGGAEF